MTNPPSGSSSLLIAMVSQDVIVLAKLVRTLCPKRVLLFCTPHARAKGWGENATRFLAELSHVREEILGDFAIVDLPDDNLSARLETFSRHIVAACDVIEPTFSRIDFDCTTGQGIFHVVGFDLLRGIAARRGLEAAAVYCDADDDSILRSISGGGIFLHFRQPIDFRYTLGQELTERFSIYGVVPEGGVRLWPAKAPGSDSLALGKLYEALLAEPALRGVFHSYMHKMKSWKPMCGVSQVSPTADIHKLARTKIAEWAEKISALTGNKVHAGIIMRQTEQVLSNYIGEEGDTRHWRAKFQSDRNLSGLMALLNQQIKPLLNILAPAKNQGELRMQLNNNLTQFSSSLTQALRNILHAITRSASRNHWLEAELETIPVTEAIREFLLASFEHIPSLFEACVGQAVTQLAADGFGLPVAGIFQNVRLVAGVRIIAELDTLILFENGGIAVVEVKTHKFNADHKKIESNIKQVRDFGGAYSTYRLVYPLIASELAALRNGRPEDLANLAKLGMVDVAEWREYLLAVERTRDQRILGLDQLGEVMGAPGGRLEGVTGLSPGR